MHLCFVPLTKDNRLCAKDNRLCAKEIIGNRARLTKWQDDFYEHMVKSFPDIERGESAQRTKRKHIPTRIFKQAVRLSAQSEEIQSVLAGIETLNAKKKRDEAVDLLSRWFPKMEALQTELTKYQFTIHQLERGKSSLAGEVWKSETETWKTQVDIRALQNEVRRLRKFEQSIP